MADFEYPGTTTYPSGTTYPGVFTTTNPDTPPSSTLSMKSGVERSIDNVVNNPDDFN